MPLPCIEFSANQSIFSSHISVDFLPHHSKTSWFFFLFQFDFFPKFFPNSSPSVMQNRSKFFHIRRDFYSQIFLQYHTPDSPLIPLVLNQTCHKHWWDLMVGSRLNSSARERTGGGEEQRTEKNAGTGGEKQKSERDFFTWKMREKQRGILRWKIQAKRIEMERVA